jgi:twitching motility protein PilT
LAPPDTEKLAAGFLTAAQWQTIADRGDVSFAYSNSFGRYRACIVKQRLGYDLTFRIISSQIRTMAELGLPSQLKLLTNITI